MEARATYGDQATDDIVNRFKHVNGVASMRCRRAVYFFLPVLFLLLSMRYLIPTGRLFPQPNLRFPVRSFSPFNVQGAFIRQFRRVGDLAHNTVLLMHLGVIRCTRSCRIPPVCCGGTACVKPEDVKTSRRTYLAMCTDELMAPFPYNTLLFVHVDGTPSISPIPNGY